MSLSSTLRRAAAPAALAVMTAFAAANANAAEQCLPGVYDAQRGIKPKDCYTTPEMNKALKALNQRSLIAGDRIGFGENTNGVYSVAKLNVFTSNPEGTIGFNIEGDAAAGQQSTQFYIGAIMSDIRLWDRDKPVLPSPEIVGSRNAEGIKNSGDRLMLSAKYGQNVYLIVVARGDDPKVGSFLFANSQKGGGLAGFKNLDYTKTGQELIKQQGPQQVSMLEPK